MIKRDTTRAHVYQEGIGFWPLVTLSVVVNMKSIDIPNLSKRDWGREEARVNNTSSVRGDFAASRSKMKAREIEKKGQLRAGQRTGQRRRAAMGQIRAAKAKDGRKRKEVIMGWAHAGHSKGRRERRGVMMCDDETTKEMVGKEEVGSNGGQWRASRSNGCKGEGGRKQHGQCRAGRMKVWKRGREQDGRCRAGRYEEAYAKWKRGREEGSNMGEDEPVDTRKRAQWQTDGVWKGGTGSEDNDRRV
jgi:hypothetical protein